MNHSTPHPHRAVFLDRDGTLMEEVDYCRDPEKVRIFPGVPDALRALRAAGFRTLLVTNQSGIGRGKILPSEYEAVHRRLLELLGPDTLDGWYMCPDTPDAASLRRKPAPGMLLEAAGEWGLDLESCWMIGDKAIDVACARAAGAAGILVKTGYGAREDVSGAVYTAEDVPDAVRWILARGVSSSAGGPLDAPPTPP